MKKWSKKMIAEGLPLRKFSRELLAEQEQGQPVASRVEALKTLLFGNKGNPPEAGA